MTTEEIAYCHYCGAAIVITAAEEDTLEVMCPRCRAVMLVKHKRGPDIKIDVEGSDAGEVGEVTSALLEKAEMKSTHQRPSPWVSGSFYLTVFVVVIAALLAGARIVPPLGLLIVLLGGIVALSIIGAFQLRQDDQLSQKNFLELMALTFKYLPWLKKQDEKKAEGK